MRVGIAGAHRVGKTTLAKLVAEKTGHPFVPNSATPSFETFGIKPNANLQMNLRLSVQTHIYQRFLEATNGMSDYIVDRTPLDYIAYTISELNTVEFNKLGSVGRSMVDGYIKSCLSSVLDKFDVLFIVPPGIEIEQDESKGVCDSVVIEHIHALIASYADISGHQGVFFLDRRMTNLDDRAQLIADVLTNIKQHGIGFYSDAA
ncbi:hypothetical protein ACK2J6_001115 [Vibrio fluvialis]